MSPIRSGVPNKPKTKTRGIRIPDDEWVAAQETAERRGETVTDEVRRALRAYVRRNRLSDTGLRDQQPTSAD